MFEITLISIDSVPVTSVSVPAPSISVPVSSVSVPVSSALVPAPSISVPVSSVSVPAPSISVPVSSIKALENAIEAVFGTSNQTKQPTRRTVLKRTEGQIITQKNVIEQLEERKSQQKTKRSYSKNDSTSAKKQKLDPKQKW